MAKPTVLKGGKVLVYLGNNADPIVYTAPCGFTSRSLSFSKSLNEMQLPDCDDPDAPDWTERDVSALSMSVSGTGVVAESAIETWINAFNSTGALNVKVECIFPSKKITYTGKMHLESFEITAPNGQTADVNVSMQSSGEITSLVTPIP